MATIHIMVAMAFLHNLQYLNIHITELIIVSNSTNISHKRLNKGMTQGKMYSIYIDPKHPAVFVLTKRIRIGTIVAIILGLFLFTGGIDFFLPMLSGR